MKIMLRNFQFHQRKFQILCDYTFHTSSFLGFFFWPQAWEILVLQPGSEPTPPALEHSLNHWATREGGETHTLSFQLKACCLFHISRETEDSTSVWIMLQCVSSIFSCSGILQPGIKSNILEVSATFRSYVLSSLHRTACSSLSPRITRLQENKKILGLLRHQCPASLHTVPKPSRFLEFTMKSWGCVWPLLSQAPHLPTTMGSTGEGLRQLTH